MAEGVHFFWLCWIFWVLTACFMPRTRKYTLMKAWILVVIAAANAYLLVGELTISLSLIALLTGGFLLLAKTNSKYLHLFTAFTVMIAYDCILIWEHEVPMWLIMPKSVFLPTIMVSIIFYLSKGFLNRMVTAVIGICCGEFFYGAMLSYYRIPYTAGSKAFLDSFVVIVAVFICFHVLHSLFLFGLNMFRRPTAPAVFEEREKGVH